MPVFVALPGAEDAPHYRGLASLHPLTSHRLEFRAEQYPLIPLGLKGLRVEVRVCSKVQGTTQQSRRDAAKGLETEAVTKAAKVRCRFMSKLYLATPVPGLQLEGREG